jgi:benzoyl-CoA reductase subunit C
MEAILQEMESLSLDPYAGLAQWKEREGKKIVGLFPMHLPPEMVHAAGMLPVMLWEGNEPITVGASHFPIFYCAIARSLVDDAIKGKLRFIDGMVFYDLCLEARGLPFIVGRNARPQYLTSVYLPPFLDSTVSRDYLMENLQNLRASLEEMAGRPITSADLNQSIAIYNRQRALLRQLYRLRQERPGLLRAREMRAIVHASMLMAPEEHISLLEQLLPELEKRAAAAAGRVKVLLVGQLCFAPSVDILDLLEECGCVVVDDDMFVGSRFFANDVAEDHDPLAALADHFQRPIPPDPTKVQRQVEWGDWLVERVQESGAQGTVFYFVKFCQPVTNSYADVRRRLAAAGIPEVTIEVEHEIITLEQARTRLQAFVEMVRGG